MTHDQHDALHIDQARFDQPWHAQAFALTVALCEQGAFTWPEWTQAFGAELARRSQDFPQNGSDDYYTAWLCTLESLAARRGLAAPEAVERMKHRWEHAYLSTPHGDPVKLAHS